MNELTGAFTLAREKGEDSKVTRQSLANAGYSIEEIEEAFRESEQTSPEVIPSIEGNLKPKKKKTFLWVLLSIFSVALIIFLILFFIKSNCGGEECTLLEKILSSLKNS